MPNRCRFLQDVKIFTDVKTDVDFCRRGECVQRAQWVKRYLVSSLALADVACVLLVAHGSYRDIRPAVRLEWESCPINLGSKVVPFFLLPPSLLILLSGRYL